MYKRQSLSLAISVVVILASIGSLIPTTTVFISSIPDSFIDSSSVQSTTLASIEARVVDCTDEESMKESGILEMNTVVVGISEPIEASITTTLIAKDSEGSKVKRVIARATSDLHEKMLKRVGADKVVFPSRMQGERLGLELVRPNLIERLELDNQTGIDEITVPEEFIGRSLRDLNLRKNYLVNVLAAGPAEELTVNPPAKYILERGNILVVMGKTADLQKLPQN